MRTLFGWSLITLLFCSQIMAKTVSEEPLTIGTKLTIESGVLAEQRSILMYHPDTLETNQKYQVIYLLDAEYMFNATVGIVEALVTSGKIPPTMVVGIETTVRVRDYLPPISGEPQSGHQRWTQHKFPAFGGTKNFTQFLQKELFPYVEQQYPVLPTRTLIGYSNGGVFGLHTLVNAPEIFTNYLLISPAAWWGEQEIEQNLQRFSDSSKSFAGNLYMTVAGEGRGMYSNALRIAAKLESAAPNGLNWRLEQLPDETHQSTIYPSIYQGLPKLFDELNFNVTEQHGKYASIDDVVRYYQTISDKYGYSAQIPPRVFSDFADAQLAQKRQEMALDTLKRFVSTYPSSSFAYSSLASGYMQTKEFALAKQNYDKAIEIVKAKNVSDASVLDFLQDMANVAAGQIK